MKILFLVALLLAPGCTRRSFDSVCQLAKDILAEPRITPEKRLKSFENQIDHFASGPALDASKAALAAEDGKRTEAFMAIARDAAPGWQCAALAPVLDAKKE